MTETLTLIEAPAPSVPVDHNPAVIYLSTLKPTGRRSMSSALEQIASAFGAVDAFSFPWWELRYQHTQAIRQYLIDKGYKPATVNHKLAAVRGVLKQAWLLGLMAAEDYHKAAAIKGVKNNTLPAGRELTPGEIVALFQTCQNDQGPAGTRDAAMLGILYVAGLRRAEITSLHLKDYNQETGELNIIGKGNKERNAWITGGAKEALEDWISIRGADPGPLFHPITKGGDVQPRDISTQAIYKLLRKRAAQAGISRFSPHDLRRTFISHQLAAGTDLVTVSKMAGHANTQTTARYDRRGEGAKREAAGRLHVPYIGNTTEPLDLEGEP